jgi:hypothetical protein
VIDVRTGLSRAGSEIVASKVIAATATVSRKA